ncbi:hypothetical protein QR680_008429 [Steinernema hermaphroditum]|uniref:Calponin-homology (CH) domain-containing protein n=1 Tax=Steinernema hermaphroditum TaxID=289476 RepID=A0AA39IIT9_9BILA|nr:hypothetical protein QR680_008429 [Steinernema hermaphroditum]
MPATTVNPDNAGPEDASRINSYSPPSPSVCTMLQQEQRHVVHEATQITNSLKRLHNNLPTYFYPTSYSNAPNFPLSPRQAEAIERQRPIEKFGNYPEFTNGYSEPKTVSEDGGVRRVFLTPPTPTSTPVHKIPEVQVEPNATMETKVAGAGTPKRVGRWTLNQLRATDGIIPSQAGWNKGDSQKLMTNFGTPRNTSTRVKAENLQEIPDEILNRSHGEVRLQSGTNKFASQRGMVNFGTGRDVCREGVSVAQMPSDLQKAKCYSEFQPLIG